jgi:hypothetical protein
MATQSLEIYCYNNQLGNLIFQARYLNAPNNVEEFIQEKRNSDSYIHF